MPKHARDDGTCFRLEMCLDSVVADRTTPRRRRVRPRPPPRPRPSRFSNGDARAFALTRAKAHTPVLTRSMRVHPPSRPHLFPVARRPRRRAARTRVSRVRCFVCGDEDEETTPDEIRVVSGCVFPEHRICQTRRAGEETQLSRGEGEQVPQNAESFGDSVVVSDAFDPAKYAARLDAFDASSDLPRDDGFGRGRNGGEPRRVRRAMATFRRFTARRSGSKAEKSREREKRRLLS